MTNQEETRERLFWRAFWVVAVLSLIVVAMCRPYMDQPTVSAASAVRG